MMAYNPPTHTFPRIEVIKWKQSEYSQETKPDYWEFQESHNTCDETGPWSDILLLDEYVFEIPCDWIMGENYTPSPTDVCYFTRALIQDDTTHVRVRAQSEQYPASVSDWSAAIPVPEPSASTLILVGIFLYWQLVKITKKRIKVKKRAET